MATKAEKFASIATTAGRTQNKIAAATAAPTEKKIYKDRKTYNEAETLAAMEQGKTAGKKGMKMPRINVAFTPSNYDYIQTVAKASGMTLTELVNIAIEQHKERHQEAYQQAAAIKENLKN